MPSPAIFCTLEILDVAVVLSLLKSATSFASAMGESRSFIAVVSECIMESSSACAFIMMELDMPLLYCTGVKGSISL